MSQSSSMPDVKSLPPLDLAVLGTGILAFIFSFFPYYGASVSGNLEGFQSFGGSRTVTAWHSYSTLALLLILFGTIFAAVAIFARASLPDLPVGARWIAAGLCSLGALLYVIRLFTLDNKHANLGGGISASEGVRWGGYLLLIVVLANAAAAVLGALGSDEQVPWAAPTSTPTPSSPPMAPPPPPPSA